MDPSQSLLLRQLLGSGEGTPQMPSGGPTTPLQPYFDQREAAPSKFMAPLRALGFPGEVRDDVLGHFGTSVQQLADNYLPKEGFDISLTHDPLHPGRSVNLSSEFVVDQATDPMNLSAAAGPMLRTAKVAGEGIGGAAKFMGGQLDDMSRATMKGGGRAGVVRFGNKPNSSKATKELRTFINDTTKIKDASGEAATMLHGTPNAFEGDFAPDKFGSGAGGNLYGKGVYLTTPHQGSLDFTDSGHIASTYAEPKRFREHHQNSGIRLQHAISRQPLDVEAQLPLSEANYIADLPRQQAEIDAFNAGRPSFVHRPLTPQWEIDKLKASWTGQPPPAITGDDVYYYLREAQGDQNIDYLKNAGYDSIKYPGGRATRTPVKHDAYNIFDPQNVIPAFPTDAQAESLLYRLLNGGG